MTASRSAVRLVPGFRTFLARIDVLGPLLVVAIVLAGAIGARFHTYDGNVTGFVLFGRAWVQDTHPPRGAEINSAQGYDGQFFWVQAKDPLLLHDATIADMRSQSFRLQRMGYPALASILALGQDGGIPWSLLMINVVVILGITGWFAWYGRRRGWSGWWALALGLMPGFIFAAMRDLSDPLAVATMLGGLMMWQQRRRWWAAALLTIAVLTREVMVLAVVAVAVESTVRWWPARHEPGAIRRAVVNVWPVVLVPALAFVIWQAYIDARYGGNAAATSPDFLPPFKGVVDEIRRAAHKGSVRSGAWDLVYISLMVAGVGAAIALLRRGVTAVTVAAAAFGLSLIVLSFGDHWSYTRLSAPLFATLLLAGLAQRSRSAVWLCASGAAMTALVPLAFNASAGA